MSHQTRSSECFDNFHEYQIVVDSNRTSTFHITREFYHCDEKQGNNFLFVFY